MPETRATGIAKKFLPPSLCGSERDHFSSDSKSRQYCRIPT
jgi:hypothetical protein